MLIDHDPMVSSYISIPKEMSQLNCAAFVAGIIEAVLDGCLFPSRVTAHSVPTEQYPGKTVFLSGLIFLSFKLTSCVGRISLTLAPKLGWIPTLIPCGNATSQASWPSFVNLKMSFFTN